jgi:hypothetical protein
LKFNETPAENIISANDSVRLLDKIVEEMDFKKRSYAVPIDEVCQRDKDCNWLLNGKSAI